MVSVMIYTVGLVFHGWHGRAIPNHLLRLIPVRLHVNSHNDC